MQIKKTLYVTCIKGDNWKGFKAEEKGNVLSYPSKKAITRTGKSYTAWDTAKAWKDPNEQGIPVMDFLLTHRNYKIDNFVYVDSKSGQPLLRSGFPVVSIAYSVIVERKDNGEGNEKENLQISDKEVSNLSKGNPWD